MIILIKYVEDMYIRFIMIFSNKNICFSDNHMLKTIYDHYTLSLSILVSLNTYRQNEINQHV
jgi:hypothetical protein